MRRLSSVLLAIVVSQGCGQAEAPPAAEPSAPTEPAAPAEPAAGAVEPAVERAAQAPTTAVVPIPPGEVPPADAPSLPGTEFPSFGTFRLEAPAYFPTREAAEKLRAGDLDASGLSYFRGMLVGHDADAAMVTVRDLRSETYDVPASYVLQAREPVTQVSVGQIVLGVRFNRAELVLVTSADVDERGQVATLGLAGFMSDAVRAGSDTLESLVPVVDGGIGSNAVCRGPNGVRGYMVVRRAPGKVLGYDGSFVRVLDEAACRFAPLRPTLAPGDAIAYVSAMQHREATVREVDDATGAVKVAYRWGAGEREDTARFGSIVRELPPSP